MKIFLVENDREISTMLKGFWEISGETPENINVFATLSEKNYYLIL